MLGWRCWIAHLLVNHLSQVLAGYWTIPKICLDSVRWIGALRKTVWITLQWIQFWMGLWDPQHIFSATWPHGSTYNNPSGPPCCKNATIHYETPLPLSSTISATWTVQRCIFHSKWWILQTHILSIFLVNISQSSHVFQAPLPSKLSSSTEVVQWSHPRSPHTGKSTVMS